MTINNASLPIAQCHNVSQEAPQTAVALPYVYRRASGRYHLRVRLKGCHTSYTLSLKTTNRPTAMTTAKHLLTTLKAFHLDRPDATWPELREHLRYIAEEALGNPQGDAYGLVLDDVAQNLREIAYTVPLGLPQAQALTMAQRVVAAAEERHAGNLKPLVGLLESGELGSIDNINQSSTSDSSDRVSVPICMSRSESNGLTFSALYEAFKAERAQSVGRSTLVNWESSTRGVLKHLGGMDLRTHTRATFVNLRDALIAEGRKPHGVNKILTHASMIVTWAATTGLLEKNYSKDLKVKAESDRTAFTADNLKALQAWALGHLGSDSANAWKASVIALGAATGARIGEIHQLTGGDIRKEGDNWIMDINDTGGKSVKNSHSRRVVPLVGIPDDHLEQLAATEGRLFKQSASRFVTPVNEMIHQVLGTKPGAGQSFHCLRHSMASDLKAAGVSVGVAQSIMGHSSGSITFDLYGGNAAASLALMVEALKLVR